MDAEARHTHAPDWTDTSARPAPGQLGGDPDWWRGAVIYQIYPRSFQDGNGDGIGDLAGARARLRHVADLGADAIWMSPFFRSPMKDFGYDVSDYRDVDPMFGTLEDFRLLVEEAHALGLRVMIDLVLSHTSDQHPWFRESRRDEENPRADWYVWADPKPDGSPPNNWLSIFGGSAWEWETGRCQYFLHNFLASQPDLNFHCPAVQDALLDTARFWLDLGVDGFRLDTVNFYFHSQGLEDNPPLPPQERNDRTAPSVNLYNWQDHRHDKTQPENLAFLARLRALLDDYAAVTTVGEVGESQRGLEVMADYTTGRRLHMCYSFEFLSSEPLTAPLARWVFEELLEKAPEAWPCWALSNHDTVRSVTRWHGGEAQAKLWLAFIATIRGSVCIYQGEELGLPEAEVAFEDLQDPYGIRYWPGFKGRDGARTPFPWEGAAFQGGFSAAERTWLPVFAPHLGHAADLQARDPGSVLSFTRALLAFRRAHPALAKGAMGLLPGTDRTLVFDRVHDGRRLACAFNFSDAPDRAPAPPGAAALPAPGLGGRVEDGAFALGPWDAVVAEVPT